MIHALVWLAVGTLLASWSLLAWAAHALLAWSVRGDAASLPLAEWVGRLALPEWLAPWVPAAAFEPFKAALVAAAPVLETVIGWVPGIAAWLAPAVVAAWALGAVLLVVLGVIGSLLARSLQRRWDTPAAGPGGLRPY